MRIAVLGDSHVAALKRAWDRMASAHPVVEVVFFAARRGDLGGLGVSGKVLAPRNEALERTLAFTSGGLTSFDPAAFDVRLLYALQAKALSSGPSTFLSNKVGVLAARARYRDTLSHALALKIRQISDGHLYLGHTPLPADAGAGDLDSETAAYMAGVRLLNDKLYAPMQLEMLPQPPETLSGRGSTKPEYAVGALRLAVRPGAGPQPRPEGDRTHMNEAFGALWLRRFLAHIGAEQREAG